MKNIPAGVQILAAVPQEHWDTLSPQCLRFIAMLQRSFGARRKQLLQARLKRQADLEKGTMPTFLKETAWIRDDPTWNAAPPAPGLEDRRVEITGPVDRKMVINALNSGASTFMADFEDSTSPVWINLIAGQTNMRDAVRGIKNS